MAVLFGHGDGESEAQREVERPVGDGRHVDHNRSTIEAGDLSEGHVAGAIEGLDLIADLGTKDAAYVVGLLRVEGDEADAKIRAVNAGDAHESDYPGGGGSAKPHAGRLTVR
jgi:hypothetical protein